MSPPADPLRNTLDALQLDPSAKEDRRYLVSVLRRLGYTETEIREALGGRLHGGEEGRLIEVEYTGKGPAVITDDVPAEEPEEGTFTVVSEEPDLEQDEPEFETVEPWNEEWDDEPTESDETWAETDDAFSETDDTVAETDDDDALAEDAGETWDDEAWNPEEGVAQTEREEVVEFVERTPDEDTGLETEQAWPEETSEDLAEHSNGQVGVPEQVEFAVARGRLDDRTIPDARHAPAAGPAEERSEPMQEAPDERMWEIAEGPAETGDPALDAGWQEITEEELHAAFEEQAETGDEPASTEEGDVEDWSRPEEAPGGSWEPVEDTGQWTEVPEDDDWHESGAWHDETPEAAPAGKTAVPEPTPEATQTLEQEQPFTLDEYTLYTRDVELSNGNTQTIFFFAKQEPKSGSPAAMPDGYVVERNARTGLPYLRRAEAGRTTAGTGTRSAGSTTSPSESPATGAAAGSGTTKSGARAQTTKTRAKSPKTTTDRCIAITKSGSRCKNSPRETSKYCGAHKGWRGPKVDA